MTLWSMDSDMIELVDDGEGDQETRSWKKRRVDLNDM